jgi:hypothetical protein
MFPRKVRLFPNDAITLEIVLFIVAVPRTSDPTPLMADNILEGKVARNLLLSILELGNMANKKVKLILCLIN